jgi:CHAT domain/Tetratricopeptide repeat
MPLMSLESSQERTEQEQPRSATSAETDHSPVVQGDSGGEQLPANVTPEPVPPDPDELVALLLSWIRTPDWSTSQTYLEAHPELLTEAAAQVLATLTQHQPDPQVQGLLTLHQQLLQIVDQQGVEAAYEALLHQGDENSSATTGTEQEELQVQVIAWLQTPDWGTSHIYLQTHPRLLTEAAEQVLEGLKPFQKEEQAQTLINLHQVLLQKARVEGIEAAYERFLAPEPEAPLSDQEVATYQDLEDPATLNDAGMASLHQYRASGQVADLNRAVECWHKALKLTPPNSPDRSALLSNLGIALRDRHARTENPTDLEDAISAFQQAVQSTPSNSPDRPGLLGNLGTGLLDRYYRTWDPADLEAAISAYEQAVQAIPPDSPDQPGHLNNLGTGLQYRYARTWDRADLEAAITAFQQAIQATPSNSPKRPSRLGNLGNGLRDRYARTGDLTDLQAAVTAYEQAVQAVPPNSPDRPGHLDDLGTGLRDRYAHTGDPTDLADAISAFQQAVQAVLPNSYHRPKYLNDLGTGLSDRYTRTGNLADLEDAISAFQQAIQATPSNSPNRPVLLNNLGIGLSDRYSRTGDLADLEAAITAYEQAVQATPPNSPNWPRYLSNLGTGLRDRYTRTGDLADLEAAITAYEQAIQTTPPNSPDRPALLNNLSTGLHYRYDRTGDLADLEATITAYEQAIQTTPLNSPDRPSRLSNLGTVLTDRYDRTGDLADLEAAIAASQQAVQATPLNSPDRPSRLNNLGAGLISRYTRTGDLADLEAAIAAYEQAVQAVPPNSPDRPSLLSNLGTGLRDRYARTGDLVDLEAAITAYEQAIKAVRPNSPDRPGRLSNLGNGLLDRYARTGDLADLEAAIAAFQQAVQAVPPDSPDRPGHLNNLGIGLQYRYTRTGDLADLEAAITAFQQAIQVAPSDSPHQPRYLNNLGTVLSDQYARTEDLADLEAAISAWERSWSIPHPRFAALPVAYQLGQQRQGVGTTAHLVTAYLEQAKQLHPRSPSVPRRALEVAEGSKSRLLTQMIGRGPLPLPSGLSQEIATRELRFLDELTALDTQELAIHDHLAPTQEETSHLQRLEQRQAALRGLEELWARITRIGPEGIAYVALRRGAAPTWQEFARLTKALGPATALLSFFTTTDRALLFLLRAGWRAPRAVEVPLSQTGWADLLERFFREVHRYSPGLSRSETWDLPLRSLFTKAQHHLEGVERLVLAPQGVGHLLPWEVLTERVGWHNSTRQPIPLVTLPALGILPRLRQRPHVPPGPALVVGNPRGDLPSAEVEANAVAELFGTKPLLGAAATTSAVLTRFPDATLIHLATHASFDANNPLESGIVLADGVLTAREVLQHRLHADLLVLSACESGQVGSLGGKNSQD